MRLRVSRPSAEELLTARLNEGYELRKALWTDYSQRRNAGIFDASTDNDRYRKMTDDWANSVYRDLIDIFPTRLEGNIFCDRVSWAKVSYESIDQEFGRLYYDEVQRLIQRVQNILNDHLSKYTDLPLRYRLYVDVIDSFRKVRDVNCAEVAHVLNGGYLDRSEDSIQLALEQILGMPFHKKDWGGEINDLYSADVTVNGARIATAFLLKGNGLRRPEMQIADCGKNGDQIVRLFHSPAQLFVVQFVGRVSEMVIADLESKVRARRANDRDACFLVMDGQDTARVLHAYGKL